MRRRVTAKRSWPPDPVFNSIAVTRFINNMMRDGEKSKAQKVFYRAMDLIKTQTEDNPFKIFQTALKNAAPLIEVWPRRVGGASYLIPRTVQNERRFSLAVKWLVNGAQAKKGRPMAKALAEELILANKGEGVAVKKREDIQKQADQNRAFGHFAWWGRKKSRK